MIAPDPLVDLFRTLEANSYTDTATIRDADTTTTDRDTGLSTTNPGAVVFASQPCRIRPASSASLPEIGEQRRPLRRFDAVFPGSLTGFAKNQRLVVDASRNDPALVGADLRVVSVRRDSWAVDTIVTVEEDQG